MGEYFARDILSGHDPWKKTLSNIFSNGYKNAKNGKNCYEKNRKDIMS